MRGGPVRFVLAVAALARAGFASTDWRAAQRLAERVPPALEGQDILVTGVVAELPRLSSIGTRFVFKVESATRASAPVAVPRRLSIGWYHGYGGESLIASPPQPLQAGDRWQLPLRLTQPHGVMNPHGFDLELWLFEQGIRASGYVRPGALWLADGVAHSVERLRQRIRDAILLRVADPSAAGVLVALAVRDQAAIERDEWDLFRTTGVAHLMSIGGSRDDVRVAGRRGGGLGVAPPAAPDVRAARAGRRAMGRVRVRRRLCAARGLGCAGAAHGTDDRRGGAAAHVRAALAAAAGAAGSGRGWCR